MPGAQDPGLEAAVRRRLEAVEEGLLVAAQANTALVTEAAQHIIRSGGKRFRPMLVATAAELGDRVDEDALLVAAQVVELTHVASLYHDDVMDEAEIRRGAPSANQRWQNSIAILVGDYLFARASDLISALGPRWVQLQARTFARLVQGQIAETVGPEPGADPLAHHLAVLADKTGSLIATSAVFGGLTAGLGEQQLDALAAYGEEVGLVFQLSDDLIDITSDVTGKEPGTDLRAGVPTLPTLMLARSERAEDVDLTQAVQSDLSDPARLAEVLGRLRAHPVIEEAREVIRAHARTALRHLDVLPDVPARQALAAVATQLVDRVS
ncbi:polyprenyl synthetase family protein [Desertihabitans brevis]|uniref:Polyprenyl synthetase family protein n=1 Tax=Desertihabitans brevis TaxID=2268447 RepID=A0A367YY16_9ACTN|nr:polyprenyl synthetase family protein [Desertihabitans brevis]RCK69831.1 polyprenyl synthetase family protein [Desertihabitans brevis]